MAPLRVFIIPYDLSYTTLLNEPPFSTSPLLPLSAWNAEDPQYWDPSSIQRAIQCIQTLCSSSQSLTNLLTDSPFHCIFNLLRCWETLSEAERRAVRQVLKSLCINTSELLTAIPEEGGVHPPKYKSFIETINERLLSTLEGNTNVSEVPIDVWVGSITRSIVSLVSFITHWCLSISLGKQTSKDKQKPLPSTARGRTSNETDGSTSNSIDIIDFLLSSISEIVLHNKLDIPFSSYFGGDNCLPTQLLELFVQSSTLVSYANRDVTKESTDMCSRMLCRALQYYVERPQILEEVVMDVSGPKEDNKTKSINDELVDETSKDDGVVTMRDEEVVSSNNKLDTTADSHEWVVPLMPLVTKGKYQILIDALNGLETTCIPTILLERLVLKVRNILMFSSDNLSSATQLELGNTGQFLEAFSLKYPLLFLAHLERLKDLFGVDVYQVRKSLMEIFKNMFIQGEKNLLMRGEGMRHDGNVTDSTSVLTKEDHIELVNLLLRRQADATFWARMCCLKCLKEIAENDVFSLEEMKLVCEVASLRLLDKTSIVRRQSLQLLSTIAKYIKKSLPISIDSRSIRLEIQKILKDCTDSNVVDGNEENDSDNEFKDVEMEEPLNEDYIEEADELHDKENGSQKYVMQSKHKSVEEAKQQMEDADTLAVYCIIVELLEEAIEQSAKLLFSSNRTDQKAALVFLKDCRVLQVEAVKGKLSLMWELIWSPDKNATSVPSSKMDTTVPGTVLSVFKDLYLHPPIGQSSIEKLILLIVNAPLREIACIEKIFECYSMDERWKNERIADGIVESLKSALDRGISDTQYTLCCLRLLRMIFQSKKTEPLFFQSSTLEKLIIRLETLLHSSIQRHTTELPIFYECCTVLNSVKCVDQLDRIASDALKGFWKTMGTRDKYWFQCAQSILDFTFTHCASAEKMWSSLISNFLTKLNPTSNYTLRCLSQFLFCCGHAAIRTAVVMEEIQRAIKESNEQFSGGRRKPDEVEANMGMATKEEAENQLMDALIETQIVCDNVLGKGVLKIIFLMFNPRKFITQYEGGEVVEDEVKLFTSNALLALCKFAAISQKFCRSLIEGTNMTIVEFIVSCIIGRVMRRPNRMSQIDRLTPTEEKFSQLSALAMLTPMHNNEECEAFCLNVDANNRKTLLICYGDLLCRFHNLLEPYNSDIFLVLQDNEILVQDTAVHVFTHLVLNGMLKPKSDLLNRMMYLILSPNENVAGCSITFFKELHKKDENAILNCCIGMLNTLSENGMGLEETNILKITEFIIEQITKADTMKSTSSSKGDRIPKLVEKICEQLKKPRSNKISGSVYVKALASIEYNLNSLLKLNECFTSIETALMQNIELTSSIRSIVSHFKSYKLGNRKAVEAVEAVEAGDAHQPKEILQGSDQQAAANITELKKKFDMILKKHNSKGESDESENEYCDGGLTPIASTPIQPTSSSRRFQLNATKGGTSSVASRRSFAVSNIMKRSAGGVVSRVSRGDAEFDEVYDGVQGNGGVGGVVTPQKRRCTAVESPDIEDAPRSARTSRRLIIESDSDE